MNKPSNDLDDRSKREKTKDKVSGWTAGLTFVLSVAIGWWIPALNDKLFMFSTGLAMVAGGFVLIVYSDYDWWSPSSFCFFLGLAIAVTVWL